MKERVDKLVERLAEGLLIFLFLWYAAIWDVLISPEIRGIPIPILLFALILLLLLFAPKRWT